MIMRRLIRFFKNTTVRVVSLLLAVLLAASFYFYKNFYITQAKKIAGFYHVHQGDNYYKRGKPQKAIEQYQKALRYYPGHYKARYNLANIYVSYEDFYSAAESYQKVLDLKPEFQIARIDYAIVLSEAIFNYDKAIEQYELAISLKPKFLYIPFIVDNKATTKYNTSIAYYNMGIAWRGKSILEEDGSFTARKYLNNAIDAYNKALKLNKNYRTYYNLAIAHHLLRDNADAGLNYCKAIEISPMNYEAHYNLALLLKRMKNYKASIDEFKKAGLIMDAKGDGDKSRYIYDVLNEATKSLVQSGEYKYLIEHLDDESTKEGQLTYIGGKVVIAQELDKAMISNFKTCKSKAFFQQIKSEGGM